MILFLAGHKRVAKSSAMPCYTVGNELIQKIAFVNLMFIEDASAMSVVLFAIMVIFRWIVGKVLNSTGK